jgi:hypothetical protein
MKELSFLQRREFTLTLKRAHSKALESGCLFRFFLSPSAIRRILRGRREG